MRYTSLLEQEIDSIDAKFNHIKKIEKQIEDG
jgi:hypothetical protein